MYIFSHCFLCKVSKVYNETLADVLFFGGFYKGHVTSQVQVKLSDEDKHREMCSSLFRQTKHGEST